MVAADAGLWAALTQQNDSAAFDADSVKREIFFLFGYFSLDCVVALVFWFCRGSREETPPRSCADLHFIAVAAIHDVLS